MEKEIHYQRIICDARDCSETVWEESIFEDSPYCESHTRKYEDEANLMIYENL